MNPPILVAESPTRKRKLPASEDQGSDPNSNERKKARQTVALHYLFNGAVAEDHRVATNSFIALYEAYQDTDVECSVTPQTMADNYFKLTDKILEKSDTEKIERFDEVQTIVKAFMAKASSDAYFSPFSDLTIQTRFNFCQAFLALKNNAYANERVHLLKVLDLIVKNPSSLWKYTQGCCDLIIQSCTKQEENSEDDMTTLADEFINEANRVLQIAQNSVVPAVYEVVQAAAVKIRKSALLMYVFSVKDLQNVPLSEQNAQTFENIYKLTLKTISLNAVHAIENNFFDEIERLLKTTLTELSLDKVSAPDDFYNRQIELNMILFKQYKMDPNLSLERQKELYGEIFSRLKNLKVQAKGTRKASINIVNLINSKMDVLNDHASAHRVFPWVSANERDSHSPSPTFSELSTDSHISSSTQGSVSIRL